MGIKIETLRLWTFPNDVSTRIDASLRSNPTFRDVSVEVNRDERRIAARFRLTARTTESATERSVAAFYEALAAGGYPVDRPGWTLLIDVDASP
jgi:uncharacterized protein (DUF2141 family)